jgi:hypothetical protein
VSSNINGLLSSSISSSVRDLAKKEERLLRAVEDFVNTGPTKKDWLYLKKRQPGLLPDEIYELPFDRVIELNHQYGNSPQDEGSWMKLPELLVDGITLTPYRDGPNQDTFVKFQLFPLLLQDQVRSLWRDPAGGINSVLPSRFTVDTEGDFALREALDLTDSSKERPSGWWGYRGYSALSDEYEDLRRLMLSFIVEIDWTRGTVQPKFETSFQEACYLMVKNAPRARLCENRACPSPYFIAMRATQKYCGEGCVRQIRKQSKLRWWNRVGDRRRRQIGRQEKRRTRG